MEQAKNARSTSFCSDAVINFEEALVLASNAEKEVAIKNLRTAKKMKYLLNNEI